MTLYQLFTKRPEKDILLKILDALGLESLDDTKIFTKKDLGEINALDNIKKILPEIEEYYLPCKARKYLKDLDNKKLITILRQFIKCFNYFLFSKERYIQGEKYITYQLMPNNKKALLKMRKEEESYIVSFD